MDTKDIRVESLTHMLETDLCSMEKIHAYCERIATTQKLAMISIGLDYLSVINQSLGYVTGDQLIYKISQRIKKHFSNDSYLFRVGRDEFIVITPYQDESQLQSKCNWILDVFKRPYRLKNHELLITASIGVSLYPEHSETVDEFTRKSNKAMLKAKEDKGQVSCYIYSPEMEDRQDWNELLLMNDLNRALYTQEFHLVYQPQVHIETGEIVGIEALIRWNHKERGLIPPAEFIPLAEKTGIIHSLGEWVIRTACEHGKKLHQQGNNIRIGVNLSPVQLNSPSFTQVISRILEQTGYNPAFLNLEITESMTMDIDKAFPKLQELKELGISLSIDDFGTGYSSLGYLKKFPIDHLKIDQSFFSSFQLEEDKAIIKTIIQLAQTLKLKVIAEGVETEEQYQFLAEQDCHEAQGYYFYKPLHIDEIEKLINR
ncbi:bifunctional diguanylate cyclase/phosphodiesterase [Ammoniphilus sp. CFH 90114]|uniref:putative bifunctional diguanylate cyclase/phosphodiesterase n=1 Tax=Ammoniphilus sp. CFH 90114 TaxID=2493665 RepID=UPI00100FF222|nr:bifunctional diguanylate cyclase/phosphodiesterase [Ammoniphilus sp. CFH 90114]RXT04539.1 bifunctional diguanylate cyclase/phosphodiesterase [Ammoniphilus sp. CFH 90114]